MSERNQCDGCARGIPVVNGIHHDGQMFGMACTKGRYAMSESETKWTKGPWRVSEHSPTLIVGPDGEGAVAETLHSSNCEDDALLIASSRSLADAIEEWLDADDMIIGTGEHAYEDLQDKCRAILHAKDSARAALRLARGE